MGHNPQINLNFYLFKNYKGKFQLYIHSHLEAHLARPE